MSKSLSWINPPYFKFNLGRSPPCFSIFSHQNPRKSGEIMCVTQVFAGFWMVFAFSGLEHPWSIPSHRTPGTPQRSTRRHAGHVAPAPWGSARSRGCGANWQSLRWGEKQCWLSTLHINIYVYMENDYIKSINILYIYILIYYLWWSEIIHINYPLVI